MLAAPSARLHVNRRTVFRPFYCHSTRTRYYDKSPRALSHNRIFSCSWQSWGQAFRCSVERLCPKGQSRELPWPRVCCNGHARPSGPAPLTVLGPPGLRSAAIAMLGPPGLRLPAIDVLGPPGLRLSRGASRRTPAPRATATRRAVFFIVYCSAENCNFDALSPLRRIKKHK